MVNIKDKILDAALEQFLSRGKSGTTTKAIADGAGVNKALIHYYFSSKDLLFMACVKKILKNIEKTYHTIQVSTITDYQDYICSLINSYTAFITHYDRQIIFLLWEYLNNNELLKNIKEIMGSSHLVDFQKHTKKAIKDGVIRDIEPLNLYINLVSLVLSTHLILPITMSFLGEDVNSQKEEIIKKRKEEVVRMLWKDIKGE